MYKFSYSEILDDEPEQGRADERRAFDHSIDLMKAAEKEGPNSKAATEALFFLTKLWTILIEDVGNSENNLTEELRAQIISIGIWILKEAENIRSGRSESFNGLIVVSEAIKEGLQ